MPTGEKLKESLSRLLNITFPNGYQQATGDHGIVQVLRNHAQTRGNNDWTYLLHKCWLIRDALPGALSIDNLLDAHASDQDFVFCGKLAIARAILTAERESRLYAKQGAITESPFPKVAGTWLIPFFQMLTENVRKEDISTLFDNLVIINFNYDRCLELFIPSALKTYYGISDLAAKDCMARAKIVHPYGVVGDLQGFGQFRAEFGADRYDLTGIASGIRTFAEGLADDELGHQIEQTCDEAERIVFLGYAYHPINMEILKTAKASSVRKVFGTTFGLSDAATRVVRSTILQTFRKSDPTAPRSAIRTPSDLDEINLDPLEASRFLESHFRGIA